MPRQQSTPKPADPSQEQARTKQRRKKRVSLEEVAALASTSTSTVSRYLTGSAPVNPDTGQLIEKAITQLGYRPPHSHHAKSHRTGAVAVFVGDVENPFFSAIAKGAEDIARPNGYNIIICNIDDNPALELEYLQMLSRKRVDALILGPTGSHLGLINQIIDDGIVVVQIDRHYRKINAPAVISNNHDAAYDATNRLIELGHKRIAAVTWDLKEARIWTMQQRLEGYKQALSEKGLAPLIISHSRRDSEVKNVKDSVKAQYYDLGEPTALFAFNNQLGIGTLFAIRAMELQIPKDVSFIAYDDHEVFQLSTPEISVVQQRPDKMGKRAMQMVIAQLDNRRERFSESLELDTTFVGRASEAKPRDS